MHDDMSHDITESPSDEAIVLSERQQAQETLFAMLEAEQAEAEAAKEEDALPAGFSGDVESEVFPPEVFSSANIPGAVKPRRRDDPRALDLRIEGLLFVTDVPLTGRQISQILDVPLDEVMETLRAMIRSFSRRRSALELRERVRRGQPAFIIDLKPEYRPDVRPLARPALPRRYIETLALIALNQPMSQARLVRERGSKVYDHVRILVERGLVSKSRDGLSYNLRTTPRFSSEFGISNNPRDLRSMLARAMTEEERQSWEAYQRLNSAPSVAEDAEEYEQAVAEAATELGFAEDELVGFEAGEFEAEGEAVVALEPSAEVEAEDAELAPAWAAPRAPSQAAQEGRVRAHSDPVKRPAEIVVEPEDLGRPMTKFERLFLELRSRDKS